MQKHEPDRAAVFSCANIFTFHLVKLFKVTGPASPCRLGYPDFILCGVGEGTRGEI